MKKKRKEGFIMSRPSRSYKHKNIPLNKFNGRNSYLRNTERMYKRLTDIFEEKIPYDSICDYQIMISAYENLYKGIVKELSNHPGCNINIEEKDYTKGHRFHKFAYNINKIIPLADDYMQWRSVYNNCRCLGNRYTPSRFEKLYSFDEFKTAYMRFETQLNRCYKGLEQMDKTPPGPNTKIGEDITEDYDID